MFMRAGVKVAQIDNLRDRFDGRTQVNNLRYIMDINDRTVLVTGASRGLGRALAFAFAKAGAKRVFAGARKSEDIEKLKSDAAAMGAAITPIRLDVTRDENIEAVTRLGQIDVLINNAGV